MKRSFLAVILLITGITHSQNYKYSENWKAIDSLEMLGRTETADSLTTGLLSIAKKNRDHLQFIKAKIYHYKFYQVNHENSNRYILENINNSIAGLPVPYRNILQSYKATFLSQYFQNNRWRIGSRSHIDDPENGEIETWSNTTLRDSIHKAFELSLRNEKALITTPAGDIEELLYSLPLTRKYRPTLFDVLAHRALEFYSNSSNFTEVNARDQFSFSSPDLYSETQEFISLSFPEAAHYTSGVKVLQTWQKLERLHQASNNTMPKVFAQLNRLEYVNSNYTGEEKWKLYEAALEKLAAQYDGEEVQALVLFDMAMILYDRSRETDKDGRLLHPAFLKRAVALAEKITREFPNTDSAQKAYNLISRITSIELAVKIPTPVTPGDHNLMHISYKSLDSLQLKIYKVAHSFPDNLNYRNRDAGILPLLKKEALVEQKVFLPNGNDYNVHSTEIVLPPLEKGTYLVHVGAKDIKESNAFGFMRVTRLTLSQINFDKYTTYKSLDRTTGEPVQNVKIEFKYAQSRTVVGRTNKDGEIILEKNKEYRRNDGITLTKDGDTLSTYYRDGYYYEEKDRDEDQPLARTMLYLDRAIYRPGQKVFFKGVLLQYKKGKTTAVPNTYVEVFVDDPNGEEIQTFRLLTNKFGSFNGEFRLPPKGITGEFEIYAEEDYEEESLFWNKIYENGDYYDSRLSFSVEEYKRPTFEVIFDDTTNSFKPGDSVSVTGNAASYMGSGINNTKLIYEVTRQKMERRWWSYTYSDPVPVIKDTIITDANGKFEITFNALADEADLEDENLLYLYNVNATVTDVSGETREAKTTLKVGYKNLFTSINLPQSVNTGEKLKLEIENTNLNDNQVPVTGSLKIYKLQGPGRITRERLWEAPEIQLIPEDEFIQLFPEEPYGKNLQPEEWPKGKMVYEGNIQSTGNLEIEVPVSEKWESGKYIVETESRNENSTAKAQKAFEVVNPEDKYLPDHQRFSYSIQNSEFLEDGKLELLLQTAYKDLNLEISAYEGYRKLFKKRLSLDGRALVEIPISQLTGEELEVQIYGIKNNSVIKEARRIRLPQVKKALTIETETFRNKIQPGLEEKWSFTVKDEKNSIPDAEVLASMYDASLDQFTTKAWSTATAFEQSYTRFPYYTNNTTRSVSSFSGNISYVRHYRPGQRVFDRLELFGFYYSNPNSYEYRRYLGNKKAAASLKTLEGNTRGIVTDTDGLPIPGVNVMIKGTQTGTQTNFEGEFALDTKPGDELIFSYIGFLPYAHTIGDSREAFIVLEENSEQLEEVVAVAYATVEDSEENALDAGNAAHLLQGKVAGVSIAEDSSGEMIRIRGASSLNSAESPLFIIDGKPVSSHDLRPEDITGVEILKGDEATALYGAKGANGVVIITTKQGLTELQNVQARKNLDETAFFFPEIKVDRKGKLQFSFTSPEALTRWKLRLLAHTIDWTTAMYEGGVITQKELSVTPNPPRFLREGDSIVFKSKISNLSDETLGGTAILQLFNALTMEPIDLELGNTESSRNFTITASNSAAVSWNLTVPKGIPAVTYRILAKAGNFSDGEENVLPVLSNRMLVTESLPLFVRSGKTKTYDFKNLKENNSESLDHHKYSLEYSSNPAWFAIQSLPYLIEFEHECSEQTFARLYANSVAQHIIESRPQIKEVFDSWLASGAQVSELEKNEELKSIILAETPWVRDAASETAQKKHIAQLFDTDKLATEKEELVKRLAQMQKPSGAWPWFSGGEDNYFITRHIVAGLGHLKALDIKINDERLIEKATGYLDSNILKEERNRRVFNNDPEYFYRSINNLHYLYARSFYMEEHPLSPEILELAEKIIQVQKKEWNERSLYEKGLLSLVLMRMGERETAAMILKALKESAVRSQDYGMYWKENKAGWFWYRSPIETQALLIEAYTELGGEEETIQELKIWLLQNKRSNHWPTTKATTEATYALLMQGNDWLQTSANTDISLGGRPVAKEKLDEINIEAGTGYLKLNWKAEEIDSSFSNIKIENRNSTAGYGGVYWQYFEDLDKIQMHNESPLNVEKELFLNISAKEGRSLKRISTKTPLKIGDLVTVRLVVRTTADMDFIHLKDMRASGFEPTNVLSEYKYQDGTAYYQSTRDAATHFFFDNLNKGTYVLEYTVRANNAGNFSNGITNIESMYAPEFSGHTKGIRVEIEE
ncbi:hypothetical protein FHG64_17390 [Antarcticibacterium flavum]|uniref:Alpha-2-macroglobulin domain-containing protein n=1 Tax=Antarcticibacterium flavum TaxID=2058175 RepID=A0A5B7X6D3_9FLAO|nr:MULTISPECIES: MG2 domain-containing protein [Antarcticibacterium]MCM4159262.1 hypothetical protein [Antarcticibacterium sp. W02-3]QCY71026.1 hypothetical protein FHG64_17390 [Antarcticibacterium flavum]